MVRSLSLTALLLTTAVLTLAGVDRNTVSTNATAQIPGELFRIGTPDESAMEFGLADNGYFEYARRYPNPIVYTVGKSKPEDWPFIHPGTRDAWAGSKAQTFTVKFAAPQNSISRPHFLIIGILADWEPSRITIGLNGNKLETRRLPSEAQRVELAFDASDYGIPTPLVFEVPAGSLQAGDNSLTITLEDGSWLVYDYVLLSESPTPPKHERTPLLPDFLNGPMASVNDIVFAVRKPGNDPHWYANMAYDANDSSIRMYNDGGRLCRLNLRTGNLTVLLDDPKGGVRDPQVNYEGDKILFSYRKGGSPYYNLYEIHADGTNLQRLTEAPYDDIEPTYLPDGSICFVSTRCNRWVNCWRTPVAVLYKCNGDGTDIHRISANIEHDNTPWPLPDGRILYTRWEYVDRSQVHYHHLWTSDQDGTGQMVYFGNESPGTVMIDAKPIEGTDKIVSIFSPGHGQREHDGVVYVVDPSAGPDYNRNAKRISRGPVYRDPWAFSETCFMVASGPTLQVMNGKGTTEQIYRLPDADIRAGMECQEPRPLVRRMREAVLHDRSNRAEATGTMLLEDI